MAKYKTIKEATQAWVMEMNAIPQGMIDKLMRNDPDDWEELTTPSYGSRVYVYELPDGYDGSSHTGEIEKLEVEKVHICMDDGYELDTITDNIELEQDDGLPMWGTMWSFGDSCDDYWLEELDGIRLMSECGFRIYHNDEFGYFFGIDGAGYDFYESHWIPLYKARGLHWHETDADKEVA